jgi:hypothetical protein
MIVSSARCSRDASVYGFFSRTAGGVAAAAVARPGGGSDTSGRGSACFASAPVRAGYDPNTRRKLARAAIACIASLTFGSARFPSKST